MKLGSIMLGAALMAAATPAAASVITFDDLGVAPGAQLNPADGVPQNSGGFTFTPGPNNNSGLNDLHFHNQDGKGDDGSTHLGTHDDVVMTLIGGGPFSIQSFDYNHYGTSFSLLVTGTINGGGQLSTTFNPDSDPISYQTFTFSGWTNLSSVTFLKQGDGLYGFFLDNIVVNQAVPEPSTWAMMLIGFGAIGFAMRRGRQKLATA